MAKNELLPFADGEDANVLPTNQWEALTDILENGFQSGIAKSEQVNRVLAQGAVASYVLGQLIVDELNQDATLDKDTLYQRLVSALESKAKDVCLPLAGGTMTGAIIFNGTDILFKKVNANGYSAILGGSDFVNGAYAQFYGNNVGNTYYNGSFYIIAKNGDVSKALRGGTDGSLSWVGKEVERVNSIGNDYIRFDSGIQICWGSFVIPSGSLNSTITPSVAFVDNKHTVSVNYVGTQTNNSIVANPLNITSTTFDVLCTDRVGGFGWNRSVRWVAIGRWK